MTPALTTRQYIATHLLAGLMAGDTYEKGHAEKLAIEATDELLRQLEESEEPKEAGSIVHCIVNNNGKAIIKEILRVLNDPTTNIEKYGFLGGITSEVAHALLDAGYLSTYDKADNMTRFTKN